MPAARSVHLSPRPAHRQETPTPRIAPRRITFIGIGVIGLPMAEHLLAAAPGEQGVLRRMREGSALVVMRTVGPRAVTGELSLFASGDPATIEDVRPVLQALGTTVDCAAEELPTQPLSPGGVPG